MAKRSMAEHAKNWKQPAERKDAKRAASMAPGKSPKDSKDSKDGGPAGWTKGVGKTPKGC